MRETDLDVLALIFDCDGTLADTMPAHYVSWTETLRRYGIDFPEDRFYAMGGLPTVQVVEILAAEAGVDVDAAAVGREKEEAFHEASLRRVEAIEPVVAVARRHRGMLPMAVATGSERWSAERILGHLGLLEWFEALVPSEEVSNPKPAPDVYVEAARRLGVSPERCRAYEDTDPGIESARAAGMDVVDVRMLHTPRRVTGS